MYERYSFTTHNVRTKVYTFFEHDTVTKYETTYKHMQNYFLPCIL